MVLVIWKLLGGDDVVVVVWFRGSEGKRLPVIVITVTVVMVLLLVSTRCVGCSSGSDLGREWSDWCWSLSLS